MPRDLKEELKEVRKKYRECLAQTMPSKEFGATLFMAMVGLHVIQDSIRKTQNLEERRKLIDEFNKSKSIIEKGIRILGKTRRENTNPSKERIHNAMP